MLGVYLKEEWSWEELEVALTLATGGSCLKAIEVLLEQGVKEDRILFLNLVSSLLRISGS